MLVVLLLNPIYNTQKVIIPEREAIRIRCQRCKYVWLYTGKNNFVARCPHCRTTVTIKKRLLQSDSGTNSDKIATGVMNQPTGKKEHNYG